MMHFPDRIEETILHTGQHYDDRMSQIFFSELGIPEPKYNLGVGSSTHAVQTGEIMQGVEEVIGIEQPQLVVVYGDTNSTMAAALAAAKMHIPVAHIEAGLRAFNKSMPEEINRIMTDHISSLLFSPTIKGIENLVREGFRQNSSAPFNIDNPLLVHCGDLMYDNALHFSNSTSRRNGLTDLGPGQFILLTLHRESNTNPESLKSIIAALIKISDIENIPMLWPVHPRTMRVIKDNGIQTDGIVLMEPVSYLDMLQLERDCTLIITDSGGVQKEAYFHQKKCLVIRNETEWVELEQQGTVEVGGVTEESILKHFELLKARNISSYPLMYGDGSAALKCCEIMLQSGSF